MNNARTEKMPEQEETRRPYSQPCLQELGPLSSLTLGGSAVTDESGSSDENENFP